MKKIIIARYKEETDWVKELNEYEPVIIRKFQKEGEASADLPNDAGREASTYLSYIVSHYDEIKNSPTVSIDEYIFSQGHPFDQAPDFIEEVKSGNRYFGLDYVCDHRGFPNYPNLDISRYCSLLGLEIQGIYRFKCGAFFKVSAVEITSRPKEWYEKALKLAQVEPESSHCLERLWPVIFPVLSDFTVCPSYAHCRML